MKKAILFMGALFFLLMTIPSYAQKTSKEQKKSKTEKLQKKKSQKVKVLTEEKMVQLNPKIARPLKVKMPSEKVNRDGHIDPITGEWITHQPSEGSFVSITAPESNLSEGEGLNGKITVQGRTIKRHRVEIRVQSGTEDPSTYDNTDRYLSKIIEDWRPVTVNAEGYWKTNIDVGLLSYNAGAD